ncbi:hypothetical protein [Micromonospora sp. CPCC 205558]|uniref:hypothetical protein n=1 Tax=Micromonospora sp. CPCC 205558 TaxID=3122403 RepID=UPI002FF0EE0C
MPLNVTIKGKFMFKMKKAAEAVRYDSETAKQVGELAKRARPRASHDNLSGPFRIYNDGPMVSVELGQWLVKMGSSLMVMNDEEFRELFEPVA